jgi:hypothetical protein
MRKNQGKNILLKPPQSFQEHGGVRQRPSTCTTAPTSNIRHDEPAEINSTNKNSEENRKAEGIFE